MPPNAVFSFGIIFHPNDSSLKKVTISSILRLLFNFRHLHFSGKYKQRRYWATKISQQNRENLLKLKKKLLPHSKISQRNRAKNICWNFKKYICGHTKDISAKQMKGYFLKFKKKYLPPYQRLFCKDGQRRDKDFGDEVCQGDYEKWPHRVAFLKLHPPPPKKGGGNQKSILWF